MGYKNLKELLVDATKFPVAIEAMLPEGAPKISTRLVETAGKVPAELPDFVMEIPTLPAPPELPKIGALGARGVRARVVPVPPAQPRYITEVVPITGAAAVTGRRAEEEVVRIITP